MENNFISTKDKISDQDIQIFEMTYNVKLPGEYAQHLLKHNGGYPELSSFNVDDIETEVAGFYSLKYGDHRLEDVITMWQIDDDILPKDLLPFGYESGGNVFCLSLSSDTYGKVYIWYHDVGGKKVFLANSFSIFMESLAG